MRRESRRYFKRNLYNSLNRNPSKHCGRNRESRGYFDERNFPRIPKSLQPESERIEFYGTPRNYILGF